MRLNIQARRVLRQLARPTSVSCVLVARCRGGSLSTCLATGGTAATDYTPAPNFTDCSIAHTRPCASSPSRPRSPAWRSKNPSQTLPPQKYHHECEATSWLRQGLPPQAPTINSATAAVLQQPIHALITTVRRSPPSR